jgi:EAL domain-containing protein (putative c-di-GMP-specific phosphodiesterase class I)/GGDEF domain-containing protein/integral membrane sensor domain MASE1
VGAAWHRARLAPVWAVVFVAAYAIAAELSSAFTTADDVSPWFLPVGLSLALVLIVGWRAAPVIWLADVSQLVVRDTSPLGDAALEALTQAVAWTLVGVLLRPRLKADVPLSRLRDAAWFVAVGVIVGPWLVALAGVGVLVALDDTQWPDFLDTAATYFVGDAIGILAITPSIVVLAGWAPRARAAGRAVRIAIAGTGWEGWAMLAAIIAVPAATVTLFDGDLLAYTPLPMAWVALRRGMPTAALATAIWSTAGVAAFASEGSGVSLHEISASLLGGGVFSLLAGAVVTERERGRARLAYLALHDDVTGLPNLRRFTEQVGEALARADRTDVAVLLVRLGTLGATTRADLHEALLRRAAHRLRRRTSGDATIARIGSGVFVVLVEGPDARRVDALAAEIVDELRRPATIDGREYLFEPTVGIDTASPERGVRDLMDGAVTAASAAGTESGRVAAYDGALREQQRADQELGDALRDALALRQLHLHFQPITSIDHGHVVGAEALLRWTHPLRGPVGPAEFIPVAEAAGLILPIGRWVLRAACDAAATWPSSGTDLVVHVNVSPVQLRDEGLASYVRQTLLETGLHAGRLCLELTESALVEDLDLAAARIAELVELGVGVVLDDFGTGASSLSWLQRLPVSALKVDRSFVQGIEERSTDWAIVGATLGLARAMRLETVAEGVETQAQLDALRDLGCDAVQGFLVCRPIPGDDLLNWFATTPGL